MFKRIFSNRLTIRQRLIALAIASVLTAVVVAAAGLIANEYSRQIMSRQDDLTAMISNHKDIDTTHDSLRAYVLLSMRQLQQADVAPKPAAAPGDAGAAPATASAEETGDGMDLAAIQDEYKEHREAMLTALTANRQLATMMDFAEAAQILDQLEPMLQDAVTTSADIVLNPPADAATANAKASQFLRTFKQPEEKMDNLAEMLDAKLAQSRADGAAAIATTRWIFLGVCAAGALLILWMAVSTFRSIARPLAAFTAAMRRLADSDHRGEIPGLDRSDEIREMAVALATLRDVSIEAARAKSSLEGVSANVMVADAEGKIVFMNKTVTAMLKNAEADIRKDLPRFDASSLIGRRFDEFHKGSTRQAELLAAATTAQRTQLRLGGRTFSLVTSPALNSRGERVGTAMEWADLTQELAVQQEVAQLVGAVAEGDLSKRLPLDGKTGFMRMLGEGINQVTETVSKAISEIAAMMAALAHGDLSERINGEYLGEFLKLKTDANATAEKLAQIVGQTVNGMANIRASTNEIASGATDLSSRTEEQVASLEEIAASVRQLNTTVQQSAENAGQASQLAIAARSSAEGGGEIANAAVKAMDGIEQSSQKISDIVGMIDEIAFQTNLLALNAAVEAARAGEAGRGFAVVAGEVRTLAQRSSQASKEIKTLISNSNTQVKQGVELVNKAGSTLGEIVTSVKRVSDIVAEIAAANREQSASVAGVQEAIGQIEQATQQNAALVEETTAALGSADNQVQGVTDVISFFKCDAVTTAKPANAPSPRGRGRRLDATGTD